jgi:hypothetical protein
VTSRNWIQATPDTEAVNRNGIHAEQAHQVVQAQSIRDVVFNNLRRGVAPWIALGSVIVLVIALTALWRADDLRVQEIAGSPRPAFTAETPTLATTKTTTSPTTTTSSKVAPDPQRALAPLDITVEEIVPQTCKHGQIVPDTSAEEIRHPPTGKPAGAVLGDGGQIRITVQGRHTTAVTLTSVRVEIVARHPAMQGIYLTGICGSSLLPRYFDLDLTQRSPRAVPQPGKDGGTEIPAVGFPFVVNASDPELLIFTVISPEEDVEWRLHLLWSSAGEIRELPVDNNGKPFRTTSTKAAKRWCWTYNGSGGWIPPNKATSADFCP